MFVTPNLLWINTLAHNSGSWLSDRAHKVCPAVICQNVIRLQYSLHTTEIISCNSRSTGRAVAGSHSSTVLSVKQTVLHTLSWENASLLQRIKTKITSRGQWSLVKLTKLWWSMLNIKAFVSALSQEKWSGRKFIWVMKTCFSAYLIMLSFELFVLKSILKHGWR